MQEAPFRKPYSCLSFHLLQSWKEFLLLFHPWPEKMLLANLPCMLTKGLFSALLSYPAKELSYFFTLQSVILPACYSSYHILPNGSLQLFHFSHSTVATDPSMHHVLFPIHHQLVISTFHYFFFYSLLCSQPFSNSVGFALGWRQYICLRGWYPPSRLQC